MEANMKTISRVHTACCTLLFAVLVIYLSRAQTLAETCEEVVKSDSQLAGVFNCDTFCLPIDPPDFRAWLLYPEFLWADFASLPKDFAAAFAQSKDQLHQITVLKLRLKRSILTGTTLIELPSGKSVTLSAPAGYQASQQDWATRSALQTWQRYIEWGELNEKTEPTLSLDIALADVKDRAAYEKSLAEEADSGSGASTLEAESSTSITNVPWVTQIRQNVDGSIRLTWNSETNGLYDIYYTQDLVTQSWELAAIQIPNQGTLTEWSDYGGPGRAHPSNVTARFYRVGLTLDSDGDELPDAYELLVSNTATNLSDTNGNDIPDGEEDFDGDGVLNAGEYNLMTLPYLADSDGDSVSDGPNSTNSIAAGPDAFFDSLVRGKIRGDNQVGTVSQQLPIPFVVYLTNTNGTPVANGSNVTFTATNPSGGDITSSLSNTSDATGNNGFAGQAQTYLTLGSATGIYTVVAHCGATNFEFRAETVTPLSVEPTDHTYQPGSVADYEVIGDVAHVRVTVSGSSSGTLHVAGVKLTSAANPSGIVATLYETAPGSGVFVGSTHTDKLKPGSSSLLSLPSSNPNPVGGNSKDDGTTEYASGDNATKEPGNFTDSDAFDEAMSSFTARGKARLPIILPSGDFLPISKSFMKAGGLQSGGISFPTLTTNTWIEDQADFFYFSGHGHTDGTVEATLDERFGPGDVAGGEWKKDLEIVIFAGCSVLDIKNSVLPGQPGKLWAKTGPSFFLGYDGSAPGDAGGAPQTIIENWYAYWELNDFGEPISSWALANSMQSAWNAAAIDCSVTPKVAWRFEGILFPEWTDYTENEW
jgi:hypothetical protein